MQPQVSYQTYTYYILTILFVGMHGTVINQSHDGTELFASIGGITSLFLIGTLAAQALLPKLSYGISSQSAYQRRLLFLDVMLYLSVATGSFLLEVLLFGNTILAGSRIFISIMLFGYFATIDNALERQLRWFRQSEFALADEFQIVPIARKLSLVMVMTLMVLAIVITLSAFQAFSGSGENLAVTFLIDTFILFGLVLGLTLRITHSYSRNLQENLNTQKSVLQSIRQGNLDKNVPVMSHDEFGMIAQQMNAMLEHLRNQERIHKTLERIVGPNIMEKLLTTDDETLKKGQQHDVAIMFCDMRDFTKMSEAASTEEVIFFMNSFFSDLSEIVSKHNGIINKFMGDAILAVYGLESSEANPVEDAIRSSLEILEHTKMFTMPDGSHPDMGAGIHFGRVVAGTIGSEQRYEYTFLGDAVNTASRLEGLTKRLGYKIVVSKSAFEKLPDMDFYGEIFMDLGRHRVRGKSEPIHIFGGASRD